MKVTFKAKAQDNLVKRPTLTRSHVNMQEARQSKEFGAYANSGLFLAMLNRAAKHLPTYFDLQDLPEGVTAKPGFLTEITFEVTR